MVIANGVAPPAHITTRAVADPLVFGYIGRLDDSKGVDKLLRAYGDLQREDKVRLKIGDNTNRWFERELTGVPEGATVEFLGWSDFTEFAAQIDVLVVPSQWQEPFQGGH